MPSYNDYRDLDVWQLGRTLAQTVYQLTQKLPPEEKLGLTSQLRRAAVAIPSTIAEGWGRRYTAGFIHFLRNCNGSRAELETQLILLGDLGYVPSPDIDRVLSQTATLGKMLTKLERSLAKESTTLLS